MNFSFKMVVSLLSVGTLFACASSADPGEEHEAVQVSVDDTLAPATKKAPCGSPSLRHCSVSCDGSYGYFCFFGTVCDPLNHRCEKASAIPTEPNKDDRDQAADLATDRE